MATVFNPLHVAAAIRLIAGLLGRGPALRQAAQTDEIPSSMHPF